MPDNYKHIFISDRFEAKEFKSLSSGGKKERLYKDHTYHGNYLVSQFARNIGEDLNALPDDYWTYITVEGQEDLIKNLKSLEDKNCGVQISRIKELDNEQGYQISLMVNKKYLHTLFKKINAYINEANPKTGKPKNQEFINSLENIKKAILEDLWVGDTNLIPQTDSKKWCEVWILQNTETEFCKICKKLGINFAVNSITKFTERIVLNIEVDLNNLNNLLEKYQYLGEFRPINALSSFWTSMPRAEQVGWVDNLRNRTVINNQNSSAAIAVLDTGVNHGHPLLTDIISDTECDTCNTAWGSADTDGHGTSMCGIAVYGNLHDCLMSGENIQINHSVASLKILPEDSYVNEDSSYGNITKEAVARGGIIYPQKKVIHCLAVTEDETANITGNPSSWSATIDSVAAGQNIDNLPALNNDNKSLFIISAGNYDTNEIDYPEANKNTPIQSPAQSWNALTVGAYTNIVTNESQSSTAKRGELSPYSTTSLAWSKTQWAVKPDVVFEGGNKVIDGDRCYQTEDTSVLTIDATYTDRIFNTMAGTSPATAQAAHFAASIATEYPNMLPETIRALMIHSAKWTDEMEEQFLSSRNKGDYVNILRTCGYGVPQLEDALYSARNSLVLIAENEIQPYRQKSDNKGTETNEMHLYELPWPQAELLALGNTDVELKVTLSYFIEPAPFSMGNITSNKYRYASHGLRFDLNRVGESKDVFVQSINKIDKDAAKANGEAVTGRPTSEWKYSDACGINNGSVHSNIWKGTAADLATSNILAVYPVMGWWKDRPALGCYNKKARYSLIVSIKTPPVETDIYTPIANLVNVSTPVPIQVQG